MARFKKMMKITGIVILCLILIIVVGRSLYNLYWSRQFAVRIAALKAAGEPLTLAEMAMPQIPEKDNAAPLYIKAFESRVPDHFFEITYRLTHTEQYGPPSDKDWANAESTLKQCSELFKLIDKAQSKPKFYMPIDKNIIQDPQNYDDKKSGTAQTKIFEIQGYSIRAARLYAVKAAVCARKGDSQGMVSAIEAPIRMGDVLDNRFLDDHFAKVAVLRISFAGMRDAIGYCTPNQAQLEKLDSILAGVNSKKSYVQSLRGQRVLLLKRSEYMKNEYGWLPTYYTDIVCYLDAVDRQIKNYGLSYKEAKSKGLLDEGKKLPIYFPLSWFNIHALSQAMALNYVVEAEIACGRAALAVEAYKNKFGIYPGKLSEVRPIGKLQIPNDPFTGKPLMYRPLKNGYVIYSLGGNQKDDGGVNERVNKSAKGADDICWTKIAGVANIRPVE